MRLKFGGTIGSNITHSLSLCQYLYKLSYQCTLHTLIASPRSSLMSPLAIRARIFSMITGRPLPLTNTLNILISMNLYFLHRSALHISQAWELGFIFFIQTSQHLSFFFTTLIQLCLLFSRLLTINLFGSESWMST